MKICALRAIDLNAYPTVFGRKIIETAVKEARHAGRVILEVPEAIRNHLNFDEVWQRAAQRKHHTPLSSERYNS